MESKLKSYGWFLVFAVVTKAVVAPMANSMNIPFIKNL